MYSPKNIIKISISLLFILITHGISAQINTEDSTVQVIGYWGKNSKQSYLIHDRKYSIENDDTTSMQELQYKVDIQIKNSTENSYTIEWKYYDYKFVTGPDELKKIMLAYQPVKVMVNTDEMGMLLEIVNFEELMEKMNHRLNDLMKTYESDKYVMSFFTKLKQKYSSKEAIEQNAFADIQQFYIFHGGKYKINENISSTIKTAFLNYEDGIDTQINVWLSEMNAEENSYIMQMYKQLDEEQLRKVVYEQVKANTKLSNEELPALYDMPLVQVETSILSHIHIGGWVIQSLQNIEVTTENHIDVEERTIEIL